MPSSCGQRKRWWARFALPTLRTTARPGTTVVDAFTNSSLALFRKFEHGNPARGSAAASRFCRQQKRREIYSMLKFYFNGVAEPEQGRAVPGGIRPRLRAGGRSTPARATSSSRNSSTSIRTARCRRSTTTACSCSTATPSCSISAKRPASFCPPNTPANRAAVAVLADVRCHRRRPLFSGQAVHFKHFAPKGPRLRPQPLSVRGAAALHDSRRPSRQAAATWSATPTPSSTWRCGAGRAWCRSCSAMSALRQLSQRQAAGRRDLGAAGGGKGDRVEGQVHLQDRNGRRGRRNMFRHLEMKAA